MKSKQEDKFELSQSFRSEGSVHYQKYRAYSEATVGNESVAVAGLEDLEEQQNK